MNRFNSVGSTMIMNLDSVCRTDKGIIEIKKYSVGTILEDNENTCKIKFDSGITADVNKVLIVVNACDVMQKEVIYNIVNSERAIYNIHGNDIPLVTGEKLYPNMKLKGKFFVPLMYETARKLYEAEADFLNQGLTIKIYDAYRPYHITKKLYKILLGLTEKYYDFLNGTVNGNKYDETDFLAAKTSTHNYGIALDMTLAYLDTKEELEMQSKMHDLSIYSVTDYNNENANMFADVMRKHGFFPLESEWWHFQDNDSKLDYMDFFINENGEITKYSDIEEI